MAKCFSQLHHTAAVTADSHTSMDSQLRQWPATWRVPATLIVFLRSKYLWRPALRGTPNKKRIARAYVSHLAMKSRAHHHYHTLRIGCITSTSFSCSFQGDYSRRLISKGLAQVKLQADSVPSNDCRYKAVFICGQQRYETETTICFLHLLPLHSKAGRCPKCPRLDMASNAKHFKWARERINLY